jgi:hypothetical protein
MAEHEPHSAPLDDQAIAEALGTRSATIRDVAYGEGVRYSVGRGDARLEVFPRTGVTRFTAQDVRVELFGSAITEVSSGGVEFSRPQPGQDASLTVVPGGGIVFTLVAGGERRPVIATEPDVSPTSPSPPKAPRVNAPETPKEPRSATADTFGPPPGVEGPDAPQVVREPSPLAAPADRETNPQRTGAETEQERIALTGRLGRDPAFRTTKTGSLVARFPLAVHREDGHTDWHTVLAFGPRAEQLQRRVAAGELTQGREVDVVGYRHVNERPGKDGALRRVQEIYAVAVKKR